MSIQLKNQKNGKIGNENVKKRFPKKLFEVNGLETRTHQKPTYAFWATVKKNDNHHDT